MPTDIAFTGQRADATGLMFYNARYYSPALGRFISADTIVPGASNPQQLNRFSYVLNSPLRYIDPSGHFTQCRGGSHGHRCWNDGYSIDNPEWTSNDADARRKALLAYNNRLVSWAHAGWITDLEGFAQLAEYGVSLIPNQGGSSRFSLSDTGAHTLVDDLTSILVQGSSLYGEAKHFQQTGFAWIFQDPGTGGEQPGHFWQWVQQAFGYDSFQSMIVASVGNVLHETILTRPDGKGRSYQDYALGKEGVYLGLALSDGMKIRELGNYIRTNLGPDGPKIGNWIGTTEGDARLLDLLGVR